MYVSCLLDKTKALIGPGSSFKDVLPERKLAIKADTINICLLLDLQFIKVDGLLCSGWAMVSVCYLVGSNVMYQDLSRAFTSSTATCGSWDWSAALPVSATSKM